MEDASRLVQLGTKVKDFTEQLDDNTS